MWSWNRPTRVGYRMTEASWLPAVVAGIASIGAGVTVKRRVGGVTE